MNNIIKKRKGFTLVELVIVIVIVGILSVISVPIYRGYVEKAKMTEGKVLLNAIAKAELAYHVQYGEFYSTWDIVSWDTVLDINAEGNKYFKYWLTYAHNYSGKKMKVESYVSKGMIGYDDYEDYVDIYVGYESPQGNVVLHMTVSSNGGCSDIDNGYMEDYYEPV
ncbi:prepilin-type N-terminal cleavage/methylation domain-containing protein [Candidatus Ruminimicrobiellum ovillum]|uniref:prepilin-type N-terminal cleavage/methylation domain-containing protein n=1 Tax=Candidatus Ruminimicrobiellum ovillum TaxID=1947927 RepID=UPI00355969B5